MRYTRRDLTIEALKLAESAARLSMETAREEGILDEIDPSEDERLNAACHEVADRLAAWRWRLESPTRRVRKG